MYVPLILFWQEMLHFRTLHWQTCLSSFCHHKSSLAYCVFAHTKFAFCRVQKFSGPQQGLPIVCWIKVVRVGIFVLFQILVGRFSALLHWVLYRYYICCVFVINGFYYVGINSFYSHFCKSFIMNGCWILWNYFSAFIEMIMCFLI